MEGFDLWEVRYCESLALSTRDATFHSYFIVEHDTILIKLYGKSSISGDFAPCDKKMHISLLRIVRIKGIRRASIGAHATPGGNDLDVMERTDAESRADNAPRAADPRHRGAPALTPAAKAARRKTKSSRQFWLKQLHAWHWISAAISLTAMFVFSVTGLTLNHAATIGAEPKVETAQAQLPSPSLKALEAGPATAATTDAKPLPATVADDVQRLVGVKAHGVAAEWSDAEVYVAVPGPGRDAWASIDRATGSIEAEKTNRGWISFFNDLHKGRNTGTAWFWFIDVLAAACVVFTFTGLLLLQLHAKNRPTTWPLVGLGTAIPLIIILFFMHA